MCNLDATSVNQNAGAPVSRYPQGQLCGMIDTRFVAALSAAMGNQGMKWDPTKINFFVLMTLLGVGLIVLIVYSLVTPSIEECLLQRANEDISNACWNLLLQEGR